MKKVSLLLMVGGFLILLYGGWNIWDMKQKEKDNLVAAKELIENTEESISDKNKDSKLTVDDFHPKKGDLIGVLYLPTIDGELPIIEGTSEDELEEGVGHYSETSLPNEKDQILLSGHRDTVFRRVGEMEIGDELIVDLPYGKFTYEIESTEIVSSDDTTVIRSTYPEEILTLSTCYPFTFIGNAPDRYIIYAKRVK